MAKKISPQFPIEDKLSRKKSFVSLCLIVVNVVLMGLLFAGSIVLGFYFVVLVWRGFGDGVFSEELIRMSVYMVIGSYFFLVVDRDKVRDILGIKKVERVD